VEVTAVTRDDHAARANELATARDDHTATPTGVAAAAIRESRVAYERTHHQHRHHRRQSVQ
jgi:hypothetical protein